MKKLFTIAVAAVLSVLCVACGDNTQSLTDKQKREQYLANSAENSKLQALLEQQRDTALNNVENNAQRYFATNPRFQPASDWNIVPHTDDQIAADCPQGSGWGWANVMNVKLKDEKGGPTKIRLFCSTSSVSLGCYHENDFKQMPAQAAQAKKCDPNLPHPLKSLK